MFVCALRRKRRNQMDRASQDIAKPDLEILINAFIYHERSNWNLDESDGI